LGFGKLRSSSCTAAAAAGQTAAAVASKKMGSRRSMLLPMPRTHQHQQPQQPQQTSISAQISNQVERLMLLQLLPAAAVLLK
jgi:hypothetical protein